MASFYLTDAIRLLEEEAAKIVQDLCDQPASDFEAYKGRLEYRKGLLRARQILIEKSKE